MPAPCRQPRRGAPRHSRACVGTFRRGGAAPGARVRAHASGSLDDGPAVATQASDSVDVAPTFATALPSVDLPTVAGTEVLTKGDLEELAVTPAGPRLSTAREALFNCVNILLGCGVLSIPYALEQGGWAAFGVLALMWISTNYTGKVLIQCQEYFNNHPDALPQPGSSISMTEGLMASYEDIAEASFGRKGREFMTAILYTELIGTCALFLILQKDHVHLLLNAFDGAPDVNDTVLLIGALAVVLPTTWLPDLAALSYVGAAGLLSAVSMTGILMYFFFTTPHAATTEMLHMHSLPVTFGLLAFVFAGHAVFPAIYKGMRADERPKFGRVLDQTYILVAAVCVAVGYCGYATFGSRTLEEVTLNLPPGALQIASTALVLVSPFAKFALTLEPVAQGADAYLGVGKGGGVALKKRGVRTGLAVFALFLATKVPFFGVFMSLLGSFLTITVSILFPCLAHLKLEWDDLSARQKALDFGILAVGGYATVAGTITAFQALPGQVSNDLDVIGTSGHAAGTVFKTLACHSLCSTLP